MRTFSWKRLTHLLLLSACTTTVTRQAKTEPPGQHLFADYLNEPLKISEAEVAELELEGDAIKACASEYAPLLQRGLNGFIANISEKRLQPWSLKCQPPLIRQALQVCDFPPIPEMPLSRDCRNQLALLRIKLVAQLESGTPVSALSPTITAHKLVAELMSGKTQPQEALAYCNHLLQLKPNDVDAHSLRVLLLFLGQKIESDKAEYETSMAKLEESRQPVPQSFASLIAFNVAHMKLLQNRTPEDLAQLKRTASRLEELSSHPLAGKEAVAVAAFYSGDRPEAIRIMRKIASLPTADEATFETLKKLETGAEQPFKIRMFYSFQF